jgi:hypothetical protein
MNKSCSISLNSAAWPVIAMLALSFEALAQAAPDDAAVTEQRYLDLIEQKQDEGGLTAAELIEPLTALGDHYFEQRDYARAAEIFGRARAVMRINRGFDTPQELPLLTRQVAAEETRGNLVEAWDLEQGLLQLAQANLGSREAVPVFVAAAEKRLDIYNRYSNGEHPPEIELGCYYGWPQYGGGMLLGIPAGDTTPNNRANCNSGDRRTALNALLVEARGYQVLAVESLLQEGQYASDELLRRVVEVLRTSHVISRRMLASGDPVLRGMMVRLLNHEPQNSAEAVRRAEFLLQLADINIVRARQARRMSGLDSVREQYEQVWQALQDESVAQERLDELFAPAFPVVLPAFVKNPLAWVPEAEASGYIDVAFVVTDKGTTRDVQIVGSNNVQRAEIRELKRVIDLSSFRPRMVDGKVVDSAPVTVRYYVGVQTPEPAAQ